MIAIKLIVFASLMSVEPLHKLVEQQYAVPVYKLERLKEPVVQDDTQLLEVPVVLTKNSVKVYAYF